MTPLMWATRLSRVMEDMMMLTPNILFLAFAGAAALFAFAPSAGNAGTLEPVRSISKAPAIGNVTEFSAARRRYRSYRGGGGGFGYGVHDNSGPRSSG
jgi:hypothetical protein